MRGADTHMHSIMHPMTCFSALKLRSEALGLYTIS